MKAYWITILVVLTLGWMPVYSQTNNAIRYGETFSGTLNDDITSITVNFDGQVGDVIYISVLNDTVPVDFTLFSPSGGQIAISNNAYIGNIELGSAGQYSIVFVRPDWSDTSGDFQAHLGEYAVASLTSEDDGKTRAYRGELPDVASVQVIEADLDADDLATLQLFGANLSIQIESPGGEYLLFDGIYNDPFIPLFRFPESGTYRFSLMTSEPGGTSAEFYLYQHDPMPITGSDTLSGELEENFPTVFAFETIAGKKWDINATLPEDGDRAIFIFHFGDREFWESILYEDYGSGPNGQPRISPFVPEEDGTYYVALWYDNWNTEYMIYDYTMTINPSTVLSLPTNSPITGEVTETTGDVQYTYNGKAGQRIAVTVTNTGESGALGLTIYSTEDEVMTFTGRNATASRFELTLPLDGTYQFTLYNVDYDTSTTLIYEILIEDLTD